MSKKLVKTAKRAFGLVFAFLLSIESFAAVVSDNNGSAFITKAEFDSLKNDFQSQIDLYNFNIDNKINNAINSYLTGIKTATTSKNKFPVGAGLKVVICDTSLIDDLNFGKADLDLTFSVGNGGAKPGDAAGNEGFGNIKMTRSGTADYEIFNLNAAGDKFDYYDKGAMLKLSGIWSYISYNTHSDTNSISGVGLRWHSNPWVRLTKNRALADADFGSGNRHEYYDDRFNHISWCWFYGTMINWGTGWQESKTVLANAYFADVQTNVSIEEGERIYYIMDNSSSQSNVWVWNPAVNMDRVCSWPKGAYKTTNQIYSTPGDAGVLLDGKVYFRRGMQLSQRSSGSSWITINSWKRNGTFQAITPADNAADWYEFHLAPGQNDEDHPDTDYQNPWEIVNKNVSAVAISTFSPYGFSGTLTEGLPIAVIENEGKITFDLDTTSSGSDLIIGINTVPFSYTQLIDNLQEVAGIKISIDGVEKDYCANELSPGLHRIVIKYNVADKQGIFFKLAIPNGESDDVKKQRKIITLPIEYIIEKTA